MYTRILVPVDGSAASARGLDEAINLARVLKACLRLVHVMEPWLMVSGEPSALTIDQVVEKLRSVGAALLTECREKAGKAGVDVDAELIDSAGSSAGECIVKKAAEVDSDLIVCGTHGRRGLRRLLMGSDAEYIVRMAAGLALSKLQRGGLECVQRRLQVEKVSSVVYTLQSALARLEEGPPVMNESTRYYIALANTVHSTGREQVPRIVRRRMREVAGGLGGIAIAPSDETPEQAEGVFQKYPDLKVVLIESGFTWLPHFLWRTGKTWRGTRPEVPWIDRSPAEIVREHVRFTLQPVDTPRGKSEVLARTVEHITAQLGSDSFLLFSTDYPHGDSKYPDSVSAFCELPGLTEESKRKILWQNWVRLYGIGA